MTEMRLISTIFIICLFGKLINCNNNNDQSKQASAATVSNDKQVAEASQTVAQSSPQVGPESRQISGGHHQMGPPHMYNSHHMQDTSSSNNLNIWTHNLSPKESAHSNNPNAPLGYIKFTPIFAPFGSHEPDQSPTTSFIRFIKPEKEISHTVGHVGRRSSLTNRLKSFMSSLFWKDSSNSNPMTSGSSYSFALKQPPFNFQNKAAGQTNYASLASASQPVMFANYPQVPGSSNGNNYNKYSSSFNSQPQYQSSPNGGSLSSGGAYSNGPSAQQSGPSYYNSNGQQATNNYAMNHPAYYNNGPSNTGSYPSRSNLNSNLNANNLYPSSLQGNTGFPPSSYQVAASSNLNAVYAPATTGNQYPNSNQQQQQQEAYNQRTSIESSSVNSSSSASSNSGTGNNVASSSNPVSPLNSKQQSFGSGGSY